MYMYEEISADGLEGARNGLEFTSSVAVLSVGRAFVEDIHNPGTPIWEDDWDVLLVLDACRVDLLKEVVDEYGFLPPADELETRWSIASMSNDWIERTFTDEYADVVGETAYVSGNPFTEKVQIAAPPAVLDEVWRYAWDGDLKTIPPRPMTDRAIETWRTRPDDVNKMIVHYMQPHVPFIPEPELGTHGGPDDFGKGFTDVWNRLGDDLDRDEVWAAYRENLRCVLDDIELLLENLDAERVAITADHGNALGEWGLYGHPGDALHPIIRRVPWVVTSGKDGETYTPSLSTPDREVASDVESRLEHLGYT